MSRREKLKVPKRRSFRSFIPDLSGGMDSVTDPRVLPISHAEQAYNLRVESGALENGYGIGTLGSIKSCMRIYFFKSYDDDTGRDSGHYLFYDGRYGAIYASTELTGQQIKIEGLEFLYPPLGVNYRLNGEDVFLLCGGEGMAVIDAQLNATMVESAPSITSLAMHNERMFVTIGGRKNAVWFSDDLDPTNWNTELDEGGFIELEGECGRLNKVVDFGGYVYVFRDYGISRLTAYGAQNDFSVTNLFVSSGKIYADTVAVCGDKIIFFASDGLYSFDGVSATRILRKYDGLMKDFMDPIACYCGGKYYLAASDYYLLGLDPKSGAVAVSVDMDIRSFSPITDYTGEVPIVHTTSGKIGKIDESGGILGAPLTKIWKSGMTDFGAPDKKKLLSEIYLDTKYPCTVTLQTEKGREKVLEFEGKRGVQRKRVKLAGTKVQIVISARGDISLARPAIKYSLI